MPSFQVIGNQCIRLLLPLPSGSRCRLKVPSAIKLRRVLLRGGDTDGFGDGFGAARLLVVKAAVADALGPGGGAAYWPSSLNSFCRRAISAFNSANLAATPAGWRFRIIGAGSVRHGVELRRRALRRGVDVHAHLHNQPAPRKPTTYELGEKKKALQDLIKDLGHEDNWEDGERKQYKQLKSELKQVNVQLAGMAESATGSAHDLKRIYDQLRQATE
jgi:hypothetical protein